MTPTLAHIADRVRRLADTLSELRVRVGRAVAAEVSRAVGDAARNLVAVALGERTTPSSPWRTATTSGHWAGDDDEYDAFHDGDDRYDAFDDDPHESFSSRAVPPTPSWPAAVAVGRPPPGAGRPAPSRPGSRPAQPFSPSPRRPSAARSPGPSSPP